MKALRKLSKSKQQMLVLVGLFAAIGVAGLWLFWISGNRQDLAANAAKIERLRVEIEELEKKAKLDAHNQPLLEQIIAFVRPLGDTMLHGDAYMWTVRELRQREEHLPVKLLAIRQGSLAPHPRRGGYQIYNASLEIEGTYDQIGMFVSDFENQFPTGEIRRMEITTTSATVLQRRATLDLAFLVYPEEKMGPKTQPKQESKP